MKVVLFCGGLGMRMREYSETMPKPMVNIGYRPIIWHIMKHYAHYGHKDFILCLGYKGDTLKNYFRNYDECLSNDFVLSRGGKEIDLQNSDIDDWRITLAGTGINSNIGQRLSAVRKYLQGDEMFLANYTDAVSDLPLPEVIDCFRNSGKTACFVWVKPHLSFHYVSADVDGNVTSIKAAREADVRVNGGFFVFRKEIFDYIGEGEELVEQPFQRLISERQLLAYKYDGFWRNMDTFKDKQKLDELWEEGDAPWEIWKE